MAPAVILAVVGALAAALGAVVAVGSRHAALPRPTAVLTVGGPLSAPPLPSGFLGFSTEYDSIEAYAGTDPSALDPVFVRLMRTLTQGQPTVLRIGGDSADHTWWPVPGMTQPLGVSYSLDDRWLNVTRALEAAINAKLILGIDLEADSLTIASTEADKLVSGLGASNVQALELGNEPELYDSFAWYRIDHHHGVTGRPRNQYPFSAFVQDFALFSSVLPHVTIAGPTIGGPGWLKLLAQWLSAEPRVGLVTVHRYPLQYCFVNPASPIYPTVPHLLAAASSTGLAAGFVPWVAIAHGHGLPIRNDELNSVSCGADPSVSYTFGAGLWAIETMFEMARVGVDGVNIHTFPGAGYELFKLSDAGGRWRANVSPEYYGLLLFEQAAPPGSRLLDLGLSGAAPGLGAWATRTPSGQVRVVLIDADPARAAVVALRVPHAHGVATLSRLRAPGLSSQAGVMLAGQRFDSSGTLAGRRHTFRVEPDGGRYVVRVPAGSAALITFGSSARPRG